MDILKRELSRKDMLKMSLLGSAALFLPLERMATTQTAARRISASQLPAPFKAPFVVPPVLQPVRSDATTDYFEVTMKKADVQILPQNKFGKTEVWGYNGIAPGPTIKAQQGRETVVRQINQLGDRNTSVHLHGSASLPQYDGYAEDVTKPGEYKDYHYPNVQNARTLWYHDHGVHDTAENAYMGLAGLYLMEDPHEQSLPLPKGNYDVPLVIKDAIFGQDGQLIYAHRDHSGTMGDVILVNGKPWPVMKVEQRKYRFRILNASNARSYGLELSTGDPLTVIGHEGGLAPAPQQVNRFRIGMAERYEVVIDFSKYRVGQQVILKNVSPENNVNYASTKQIMRFDVAGPATDTSNNEVPAELNPDNEIMKLTEADAKLGPNGRPLVRQFKLDRSGGMWAINGKIWNPNRVDANPGLNDVEIWEVENSSGGWFHPLHIHLVDFKILSRDGRPPHKHELGAKDVVYIGEGETVRLLVKFGPHEGKYMIHCHNLSHEDHDMMTQFEVGSGGPDPVTTDPAKPYNPLTTPAL